MSYRLPPSPFAKYEDEEPPRRFLNWLHACSIPFVGPPAAAMPTVIATTAAAANAPPSARDVSRELFGPRDARASTSAAAKPTTRSTSALIRTVSRASATEE